MVFLHLSNCSRPRGRSLALAFVVLFLATVTTRLASAGEYYVTDRFSHTVLAFDEEGAFSRVVFEQDGSLFLDEPNSLAIGPDGDLLVASVQSERILRIDPATGSASTYVDLASLFGANGAPGGLAYDDATGELFVSQLSDGTGLFTGELVARFNSEGTLIQLLGIGSGGTGRSGMAFDANGDLYVSALATDQFGSGAVLKYERPGSLPGDYAPAGVFASGGGLQNGQGFNGVGFDAEGDLHVAALFGQGLLQFDVESGSVVGSSVSGPPVAYPSGVLVEDDAAVLVTSLGNNNPADPIYGAFLFPGTIRRVDPSTGESRPFLLGDFDGSAEVDGADLAAWESLYGVPNSPGVIGTSGRGFLEWQRGLGNEGIAGDFQPTDIVYVPTAPALTTVPEPAAGVLALAAAGGLAVARRRLLVCRRRA